jgi:hypothetical protein
MGATSSLRILLRGAQATLSSVDPSVAYHIALAIGAAGATC